MTLLDLLKSTLLLDFGPPLLTFLTGVQAANGDPVKISAGFIQLQGDLIGHAPQALGGIESELAAALAGQIQAQLAKVKAPSPPA